MPHLLIVEDEHDLARLMTRAFTREGFTVAEAASGRLAREALATRLPACILLDLMLPDVSGLELCREFKAGARTRNLPVIMVTARGEEVDRVVGFELGADDYVTKPFSPRELVLRVRAVLRRAEPANAPRVWQSGTLHLDEAGHRVTAGGRAVSLTALEFRLLARLIRHPGMVQARAALLDGVWGYGAEVTTRTLDTHIKRLRRKLGTASAELATVRGVGYRLGPAS